MFNAHIHRNWVAAITEMVAEFVQQDDQNEFNEVIRGVEKSQGEVIRNEKVAPYVSPYVDHEQHWLDDFEQDEKYIQREENGILKVSTEGISALNSIQLKHDQHNYI